MNKFIGYIKAAYTYLRDEQPLKKTIIVLGIMAVLTFISYQLSDTIIADTAIEELE